MWFVYSPQLPYGRTVEASMGKKCISVMSICRKIGLGSSFMKLISELLAVSV